MYGCCVAHFATVSATTFNNTVNDNTRNKTQQVLTRVKAIKRPARLIDNIHASGFCAWRLTCTSCSALPFGRNIFDEATDKSKHQQNTGRLDNQTVGSITPYSIFIAISVDSICSDYLNPAFQAVQDGRATHLSLASSLWSGLSCTHKELWYQVLLPACASLNQEIATTTHHGQLAGVDLLQRVYTYMAALPAPLKNTANDVLLAALSRDVQGSMLLEGGGAYGDAPPPPDLAAGGREAWAYADDERDEGSIRTALAAAGLTHVVVGGWGAVGAGPGTGAAAFTLDGHPAHGAGAPPVEGKGNLAAGSQQESTLSDHVHHPHQPRYPEPDVRLVTRMRPQPARHFWSDFLAKCQLAWEVFFPCKPTLTPAGAMRARLQMILVSDRSGLDLSSLMRLRDRSVAALAEAQGWDAVGEVEVHVGAVRAGGERVVLALPLAQIPGVAQLRDAGEYDYEGYDVDSHDDDMGVDVDSAGTDGGGGVWSRLRPSALDLCMGQGMTQTQISV